MHKIYLSELPALSSRKWQVNASKATVNESRVKKSNVKKDMAGNEMASMKISSKRNVN